MKRISPGVKDLHGNFAVFGMDGIGYDLVILHFSTGIEFSGAGSNASRNIG